MPRVLGAPSHSARPRPPLTHAAAAAPGRAPGRARQYACAPRARELQVPAGPGRSAGVPIPPGGRELSHSTLSGREVSPQD